MSGQESTVLHRSGIGGRSRGPQAAASGAWPWSPGFSAARPPAVQPARTLAGPLPEPIDDEEETTPRVQHPRVPGAAFPEEIRGGEREVPEPRRLTPMASESLTSMGVADRPAAGTARALPAPPPPAAISESRDVASVEAVEPRSSRPHQVAAPEPLTRATRVVPPEELRGVTAPQTIRVQTSLEHTASDPGASSARVTNAASAVPSPAPVLRPASFEQRPDLDPPRAHTSPTTAVMSTIPRLFGPAPVMARRDVGRGDLSAVSGPAAVKPEPPRGTVRIGSVQIVVQAPHRPQTAAAVDTRAASAAPVAAESPAPAAFDPWGTALVGWD